MIWFEYVPELGGTIIRYPIFIENPLVWIAMKLWFKGYWIYVHVLERDLLVLCFILSFLVILGLGIYIEGPTDGKIGDNDHLESYLAGKKNQRDLEHFYPPDPFINFNGFKAHRDGWFPPYEKSLWGKWHYWWYDKYFKGTWAEKVWFFSGYVEKVLYKWFGW